MKKSPKASDNPEGKINDLIFRELLNRGYSIEGNTRVWNIADSKLWYLTPEQAKAFLDLEKRDSKQKMFVRKEINLINSSFNQIKEELDNKKINIADLGCGDGEKALVLAKNFKDKKSIRYFPLDVSPYMVSAAIRTFSRIKSIQTIKSKHNVSDFFSLDAVASGLKNKEFKINFMLLLGGSLENSDVHQLLHDIRRAMRDQDYLLIGNKLTHPDPEKMVKYYNSSKHIEKLMFKTVEQLGFNKKEGIYGARWRGSRIEMYYTIKENKTIKYKGKKVEFKRGDKIIIAISYKYTKDKLLEYLNLYFNDVELFTSKDDSYALALCKK